MREIKFRAWDGKKMLDNPKFEFFTHGRGGRSVMMADENEDVEIMQYTGLKDKNGKEIYEGDIVEYSNFNGHSFRKVVVYLAPQFYLAPNLTEKVDVDTFSTPTIHETVIGNIYENPELLK